MEDISFAKMIYDLVDRTETLQQSDRVYTRNVVFGLLCAIKDTPAELEKALDMLSQW